MVKAALTPLAIAVLALLAEREMHPYEMYQLLLERREDRMVKVRPGSLYHTVERLEKQQLIKATGTARDGNRPERTSYALSPSGQDALTQRVFEMLREPVNEYPQFPVAISEAHNLPRETVVGALRNYSSKLEADLTEVDQAIKTVTELDVLEAYWLGGDYLRTLRRAELDWVNQLIVRLENEELPWPDSRT